jgi:hypothetical protein
MEAPVIAQGANRILKTSVAAITMGVLWTQLILF